MTTGIHEDKSGFKSIISFPWVYNVIQLIAGARMYRSRMVQKYIKPFEGCRILDIGCGTGEYVGFLDDNCKNYEYYGFDAELSYVNSAQRRYCGRQNIRFSAQPLTADAVQEIGGFDIVMAIGVMHHMDDPLVLSLLRLAKSAMKPAGRFVTYDPGYFSDMNRIERFFVKHDRGRNIRTPRHYDDLISQVLPNRECHEPSLTYYPTRNVVFVCQQ
jgi:SAM-dependent methyltransferase